jgi:hypothetical protein
VGITRKDAALLAVPPTVTITSIKPGRSVLGTGATILESDHEVGVVAIPPMVTVLLPCVVPKPEPLIVTDEPTGLTGPADGEILAIAGAATANEQDSKLKISKIALRRRRTFTMVVLHLKV